jgi:hypothetical protein
MSDPAAKETRAMAQTVHPLDFHPLNVQQLSVMEATFLSLQSIEHARLLTVRRSHDRNPNHNVIWHYFGGL